MWKRKKPEPEPHADTYSSLNYHELLSLPVRGNLHKVQPGETLWSIALDYHITWTDLYAANQEQVFGLTELSPQEQCNHLLTMTLIIPSPEAVARND